MRLSISSNRTTRVGRRRTSSVSWPPVGADVAGGAPSMRATGASWTDMSSRMSACSSSKRNSARRAHLPFLTPPLREDERADRRLGSERPSDRRTAQRLTAPSCPMTRSCSCSLHPDELGDSPPSAWHRCASSEPIRRCPPRRPLLRSAWPPCSLPAGLAAWSAFELDGLAGRLAEVAALLPDRPRSELLHLGLKRPDLADDLLLAPLDRSAVRCSASLCAGAEGRRRAPWPPCAPSSGPGADFELADSPPARVQLGGSESISVLSLAAASSMRHRLVGQNLTVMGSGVRTAAATIAESLMRTPWCTYSALRSRRMLIVSSTVGSDTITGWNRAQRSVLSMLAISRGERWRWPAARRARGRA